MSNQKYDTKHVIKYMSQYRPYYILLTKEYVSIDQQLEWYCTICNCTFEKSFDKFKSALKKNLHRNGFHKNCKKQIKGKYRPNEVFSIINQSEPEYTILNLDEYRTKESKLRLKCPKHKPYYVDLGHFMSRGQRCLLCSNNSMQTPEEIQEWTQINRPNFELLSTKIRKNKDEKLLFKCPLQHEYYTKLVNFKAGFDCPYCGNNLLYTLPRVKHLVYQESPNLNILSTEYIGHRLPLHWKCDICEDEWHDSWSNFTLGRRCSNCAKKKCSSNEEIVVRKVFEEMIGHSLNSSWLPWMINPNTGCKLQLDGYNKELNLAFEYDGIFHYKPIYGENTLLSIQKRDKIKDQLCENRGTILIRIPYWEFNNKEGYIFQQLVKISKQGD